MAIESPVGDALDGLPEPRIGRRPGERRRRVMLNSGAALAAKLASFLVTLALFPLLIGYLGKAQFAVWIVVVSFVQLLAWTDLGLGNGTLTRIARRSASAEAVRATVSAAYACIGVVSAAAALAFAALWGSGALASVLRSDAAASVPGAASLYALGLAAFVLWLPTALAASIQTGLRMGGIANLCQAGAALAMGASSYAAVRSGRPLADLVAIACFTPVAFNAANTAIFLWRRPELRPRWRLVSWPECRELLKLSLLFLSLQVGVAALTGVDGIIALHRAGAGEAVDYSAVAKLFGAVSAAGATLFSPLWPEYGAAHARGESGWVRRTYLRSLIIALAMGIASAAALAALAPRVFELWLGPEVRPSTALILLAATWLVIDLVSQCTAMMLNGMAVVRPQIVTSLLFAAACIPAKWMLAQGHGAAGIYAATIGCYLAAVALPYAVIVPKLLRRTA